MSIFSRLLGKDNRKTGKADPYDANRNFGAATLQQGSYTTPDRNRFLDLLGGGQDALNTSIRSAVSAAMPGLQQTLQGSREDAIRRGISTGDLGTSYEGDILSAFQKNIANSAGSQALALHQSDLGAAQGLYENDTNRYLDMLSGTLDRKQAARNAKRQSENGLANGIMSFIGQMYGSSQGGAGGKAAAGGG